MRIRSIYLGVVLLGATVGGAVQAQQPYPSKPIRIVVAYAAGQGTDIATRYLADQMGKDLGQPIVVENKPGAGGNLGTEMTALAAPDGYTLTMGTNATHALNAFLYAKVPFEAERDFEPIGLVGTFPMIVAVNANAPYTSLAQLLDTARGNPRSADIAMPSANGATAPAAGESARPSHRPMPKARAAVMKPASAEASPAACGNGPTTPAWPQGMYTP